jgi:hypothetical protein
MSKQTTIKVNKSFDNKMLLLQQTVEDRVKDELFSIADYAIAISPVDTGAYVESFSMLPAGQGGGRSKRSEARTASVKRGTASRQQFTDIARSNLYADVEKFSLEASDKLTLRNRAPHAQDVEDKHGWSVFTKVRNKFGG